jgi:hypothetical protein
MNALTTGERAMLREPGGRDPGDPFPAEPDDARAARSAHGYVVRE